MSGLVSGKYAHAAQRLELDYRLAHPVSDVMLTVSRSDDLIWRYSDAAMRNDRSSATGIRTEFQNGESRLARREILSIANGAGFHDDAAALLLGWFDDVPVEDRSNPNVGQIESLSRAALDFMRSPAGDRHPSAPAIWQRLQVLMAGATDVTPFDCDNDFAALVRQRQ